ncbi:MAG: HAD family phosphatase [Bacillota bacterium]
MDYMIFDLDGTLLDSMPVWFGAGKNYLLQKNILWDDEILEVIKVLTLEQTSVYFKETFAMPDAPEEIERNILEIVGNAYRHTIEMKPFVREFLDKQLEIGTKMCILTASNIDILFPALERLDMVKYFEFVMTCSEENSYKNEAEIYLRAMKKLGGTIENTIVFEDAFYAIKGAYSAGLTVYAISEATVVEEKSLLMQYAKRYIESYEELL